jgi:hypothetical protein
MQLDFYLYFSQDINISGDCIRVILPKPLYLDGVWEVALSEVAHPNSLPCFLCVDFINYSIINNSQLPILRQLFTRTRYLEFHNEHFVRVSVSTLQHIHIFLCDESGTKIPCENLKGVLHFRNLSTVA